MNEKDIKELKGIGRGILEFIGILCVCAFTGDLFRAYTLFFIIPWVLLPIMVTIARYTGVSK